MTTQEFSDAFDTLLNTYSTQSRFGEAASKAEIALDEYEKSVFLTQAQDQIVKSYFDARLNSNAQGMDDSERRQVDFSTLITTCVIASTSSALFEIEEMDDRLTPSVIAKLKGSVFSSERDSFVKLNITFDGSSSADSAYTLSVSRTDNKCHVDITFWTYYITGELNPNMLFIDAFNSALFNPLRETLGTYGLELNLTSLIWNSTVDDDNSFRAVTLSNLFTALWLDYFTTWHQKVNLGSNLQDGGFDDRGILYTLPDNILFILNEKLNIPDNVPANFVVKPLHYREYDREMSKAYAQPLKKQVWRLFNNVTTGFDLTSELIPSEALLSKLKKSPSYYKIRYIRRPNPIILVDLPNGLNIDGHSEQSECTLNPIIHQDILNEAFRLAVTTRGGTPAARQEANQRRREE